MQQQQLVLIALFGLSAAVQVAAHGGKLHPGTPETSNYIRVKVASCSNWVAASGTIKTTQVVPAKTKIDPVDVKVGESLHYCDVITVV